VLWYILAAGESICLEDVEAGGGKVGDGGGAV
jgi:hypothetical protein